MFDRVWQHFVVEKHEKSKLCDKPTCSYYISDTQRCAIGIFLDRADAIRLDNDEDGVVIGMVLQKYPEIYDQYFEPADIDFLNQLQLAHDGNRDSADYDFHTRIASVLRRVAGDFHLTVPPMPEMPETVLA